MTVLGLFCMSLGAQAQTVALDVGHYWPKSGVMGANGEPEFVFNHRLTEALAVTNGARKQDYLRTTYRFVIVKDLQVNSTDDVVRWHTVFDTASHQAGVHSELNIDNMGRFIVLEDKTFTLDGDDPKKTLRFLINGSSIGSVRYNGPNNTALTDKGVYVIWSAFVMGYNGTLAEIKIPVPVGNSRLCFTDE